VRAALERQRTERSLDTPMLCHGTAGLGQVTLHMAADTGAEDLSREARRLCLELVDQVDPDAPFGYRSEARLRELWGFEVDPTLLNGAPGPALVLLAAATDADPGWDRAMLLTRASGKRDGTPQGRDSTIPPCLAVRPTRRSCCLRGRLTRN
jgi:lantibiotic biosynthesis protein